MFHQSYKVAPGTQSLQINTLTLTLIGWHTKPTDQYAFQQLFGVGIKPLTLTLIGVGMKQGKEEEEEEASYHLAYNGR